MAIIKGANRFLRRLNGMRRETPKRVLAALYAAGQEIEIEAERSITQGSISGKNHVPSLPGQPPNADTRLLDTNIETKIESKKPPTVTVTSHAPYSAALEYGTSQMAERPFMRPALEKSRKKMLGKIKDAVNVAIKES